MLLIGGPSGSGKSTAARELGRRLVLPWLQIDDLRLALEFSDVRLPERTDDLYFFLRTPDVWQRPPEALRDAPLAVAEAMAPSTPLC